MILSEAKTSVCFPCTVYVCYSTRGEHRATSFWLKRVQKLKWKHHSVASDLHIVEISGITPRYLNKVLIIINSNNYSFVPVGRKVGAYSNLALGVSFNYRRTSIQSALMDQFIISLQISSFHSPQRKTIMSSAGTPTIINQFNLIVGLTSAS